MSGSTKILTNQRGTTKEYLEILDPALLCLILPLWILWFPRRRITAGDSAVTSSSVYVTWIRLREHCLNVSYCGSFGPEIYIPEIDYYQKVSSYAHCTDLSTGSREQLLPWLERELCKSLSMVRHGKGNYKREFGILDPALLCMILAVWI